MTKRANQWANLTTHHLVRPSPSTRESHRISSRWHHKTRDFAEPGSSKTQHGPVWYEINRLLETVTLHFWLAASYGHQSLLRGWSGVVVNKCKQDKQACFFCSPPFSGPLVQKLLSRGIKGSRVVQFWRLPSGWMCMWCLWTLSRFVWFGSKWSKVKFWWFWTHHSLASTRKRLRRNMRSTRCIERVLYGFTSPQCLSPNTPRNSLRFDRSVV